MAVDELTTPGQRIRWLRMSLDFKQQVLADRVAVTQTAISQIEHDEWVPRPVVRRSIAEALGVHESLIWRPDDLAARTRAVV